jgi:hypothetical protein
LLYNANNSFGPDQLLFAINPHLAPVEIELYGLALETFRQLADHERFLPDGLPETTRFAWNNGKLKLPPLSVGLWRKAE